MSLLAGGDLMKRPCALWDIMPTVDIIRRHIVDWCRALSRCAPDVAAQWEGTMLCALICTVAFITGTFTGVLLTDIRKRS